MKPVPPVTQYSGIFIFFSLAYAICLATSIYCSIYTESCSQILLGSKKIGHAAYTPFRKKKLGLEKHVPSFQFGIIWMSLPAYFEL